ncbi:MAG: MGMT family protein [Caldilineaceae bacterium]|nr:MGMT family protein [Caldilineaceae bacterium]
MSATPPSIYDHILAVVCQIPRGRVASYGQIAWIVNAPTPRMVGYALAGLAAGSDVPWQRVINSQGGISPRGDPGGSGRQRKLLEAEGVEFGPNVRVDFARFGWDGPDPAWLAERGYTLLPWPGKRNSSRPARRGRQ